MHIICTTIEAAAEVLLQLLSAEMGIRRDFTIHPVISTTPPITFTMLVSLAADQVTKLRAIPDTTITE